MHIEKELYDKKIHLPRLISFNLLFTIKWFYPKAKWQMERWYGIYV